jgi:hypothetical protein
VRAWENTVRPALDNLAGALNRLDEGTATVRVADGVTAAGHGPFAGAADTVYSVIDRVDQSMQAEAKATPLDAVREAPAPAGTPNTPVRDTAVDLAGNPRELPGRAPEDHPTTGDADGGSGKSWHNDLIEAPRPPENAAPRHGAEGPVDSATPGVQGSAAAPRGAGNGVAVEDPTSAPPHHVADSSTDSGAAPSDQQIADTPIDLAPAERPQATSSLVEQDLDPPTGSRDIREVMSRSELSADELAAYLQATNPLEADNFARTGAWPEKVQIPRDASVLTEHGTIDWDQVPRTAMN